MGFSNFKNKIIIFCAISGCMLMVLYAEVTAEASKEAIRLWLNAVVPTLFPFIVITNFIQRTNIAHCLPIGIYPLCMAMLSGYPVGAKIAGDIYRANLINQKELWNILSYSMVTGPAFIVGAVGVSFFQSQKLGCILAVSHYLGALINGLCYGGIHTSYKGRNFQGKQNDESYYEFLTDSILDSFRTIGVILAYIMIFMIGTEILQFMGFFAIFQSDYTTALAKGLLEMTLGCHEVSNCQCSMETKLVLTSFLISFGGMSIIGQSMSMLKECPISLIPLLKMKVTHGVISAILTFTIYAFVV